MSENVYSALLERVGEQSPRPRIEPTAKLVDMLGSPQSAAAIIHITGTNGKTTTSRVIESILRANGMRTGMLTSPHLERFNERIRIDGQEVNDHELELAWEIVKPIAGLIDAELAAQGEVPLTFFEVLTGLAFVVFADAPVDVIVLEVGMGGEWDSTNVADADVAVFTPIGLDHIGRIGNTIEEIASTKAGIMKQDCIAVTSKQQASVMEVLRTRAAKHKAPLMERGVDFEVLDHTPAVGGQMFSIRVGNHVYEDLSLPLFGEHQVDNAALAIAAVHAFLGAGTIRLNQDSLELGLSTVTSPGRLEIIGTEPLVILDGAHNPHGAHALAQAVPRHWSFDELALVVGVLADKDVRGVLEPLMGLADEVIVTKSSSERAASIEDLVDVVSEMGKSARAFDLSQDALEAARAWATAAENRAVLVTGSLTLVGEVRGLAKTHNWKARHETS